MMTIKYVPLPMDGSGKATIELPIGADFLGVEVREGSLCLIVTSQPSLPGTLKRTLAMLYVEGEYDQTTMRYIGTAGSMHVFEVAT